MKSKPRDEDLARAEIAMKQAALDARRIAFLTKTPLVVFEGGKVVKKWMSEADLG